MKCTIPEISWHNRDPVLSLDVQPVTNEEFYRLATGGTDSHVLIWHLKILDTGATTIEPVSDLARHQRAVNVVRWSPSGHYLASGDDDANIIIWHQKADDLTIMLDGDSNDKEKWSVFKVLRGHKEDVYDICWSPDSTKLVSGSVDNSAIIWNLRKGKNENILQDHKGFVQGVAWDPLGEYIATLSSDRTCRVFNESGSKVKSRISKGNLPFSESHPLHGKVVRYYHDDTFKSFYRRLSFSPDGNFLITPAGFIEAEENQTHMYATYIFSARSFSQPAAILPSGGQYTVAVRCCPILFELSEVGPKPVISLKYRMIIAVATRTSIILYDTQQMSPFAVISDIHYTRLTDVTWSSNGRLLAASSTDGFCSLVTFEPNEFGIEYIKEEENVTQEEEENISQPEIEEVMDTSLNVSIDNNTEEKKEKKPSFLQQWALKTPKNESKNQSESGNKSVEGETETKDTTLESDDGDVIFVPDAENEKENKNKENELKDNTKETKVNTAAKPIAFRRKPNKKKEAELTVESIDKKESTSKDENKDANTETKTNPAKPTNTTAAKPIAVRRKPRSDQMNITQFLKTAKEPTPKKNSKKLNKTSLDIPKPSTSLISEDSVARDAWVCDNKVATDDTQDTTTEIIACDIVVIEDSQDIKLVLEDSTMSSELLVPNVQIKEMKTEESDQKTSEKTLEKSSTVDVKEDCIKQNSSKLDPNKMDDNDTEKSLLSDNRNHVHTSEQSASMVVDTNVESVKDQKENGADILINSTSSGSVSSTSDKVNTVVKEASHKKRVALITLASPKSKKKRF